MRRILAYSAIAGLLCGSVMAQTNSFWNVRVSTNLFLGTSTITTSNGTLLVNGSPITGGGITNATGPGITVASGLLTLSTNGWQFGAALTPWTTNVDAAGFSLLNVGTLSAANINFGDNSLADMLASRLSTNYNGAWLVGSGGVTNNWTGGAITIDSANSKTNTFGGFLVIGPDRYQANGGTASGEGSWANNSGRASGLGSWANNNGTASGDGSWANYSGIASGAGSWANYFGDSSGIGSWANNNGTARGDSSWAMGDGAEATHDNTFVWSDGTAIGSTTNKQFTVYSSNGIRLLGGPITGNGSLITNVNAATLGGIPAAGYVQTNAALDRLRLNDGGGLTNLPSGGSTGMRVMLTPGGALTFGSVSNALIVGTAAGGYGINTDTLQFDPTTPQLAPWQMPVIAYTGGAVNVAITWSEPTGGAATNVWEFWTAQAVSNAALPSAWVVSGIFTQQVNQTATNLTVWTGTITPSWTNSYPAPAFFGLFRNSTNTADNAASTSSVYGVTVWQ